MVRHLQVEADTDGRVRKINLNLLGRSTIAYCMSYLDSGLVFIGSRVGNSQILRCFEAEQPDTPHFTKVC